MARDDFPCCHRHRPDLPDQKPSIEASQHEAQNQLKCLPVTGQQAISSTLSFFSTASADERKALIDGLLGQCCSSQLSYISTSLKTLIRLDFFAALPTETSLRILEYHDATTLCRVAQVSRLWQRLAEDDLIWRRMCLQHVNQRCARCRSGIPLAPVRRRQQQRSLPSSSPQLGDEDSALTKADVPCDHDAPTKRRQGTRIWKYLYQECHELALNWKYGQYNMKTVLWGHTSNIVCLEIHDNFLATGACDNLIKLWGLESGQLVRTFVGHTNEIHALQFNGNRLASGGMDTTIKIWDWKTGQCLDTLFPPNNGVSAIDFAGDYLAAGHHGGSIHVWNLKNKKDFGLYGHGDTVTSVQLDTTSRTLISSSDDCFIRLWDLDKECLIKKLEGHCGEAKKVIFSPPAIYYDNLPVRRDSDREDLDSVASNYGSGFFDDPGRPLPPQFVLSCSCEGAIRLWNTVSGACVRVNYGHDANIWGLAMNHLHIVSGADDSLIKVWDTATGKCLSTLDSHIGEVSCLAITDSLIAVGGSENEVMLYHFDDFDRWG